MATGALGIKLRCASWQQLATIYKRDLSRNTMFLKSSSPPAIGTTVRIDLTLPSGSVIALSGTVDQHVDDPQRGAGVLLALAPIPTGSIWLIESALASEAKRAAAATPPAGSPATPPPAPEPPPPPAREGEDLAAAEIDLIRALVAEAESLRKLNPFLVLGLGYEASDADVRAAFAELTKRYHPDRFARYQSTELRQVAAEIFILIRDAYRRLGDEQSRHSVLSSLGRIGQRTIQVPQRATPPLGSPSQPVPVIKKSASSSQPLPKAATQKLDDEGSTPTIPARPIPRPVTDKPSGAIRNVVDQSRAARPSVPQPPSRPTPPPPLTERRPITTQAPAGLSDAADSSELEELLDAGRIDEALAGYKLLAKKHPNDRSLRAGIELCEGLAAIAQRDRLEAAQRFEAALEIDPSNERAARELADMRRQATNERKGLLSRLMGKKETP